MNSRVAMSMMASLALFGCGSGEVREASEPDAPGTLSQEVAVNTNAGFLVVYNVNYENLPTASDQCAGDWQDLIYYMKTQAYSPDAFIVHQMSGAAQAAELAKYMQDNLPGLYDYVIAEANPEAMNSPCGPAKDYQTNAIIYRTGRLQPIAGTKATWQVYKGANGSCVPNHQARTISVRMAFTDLITNKKVVLGSSHWPTAQEGPSSDSGCAERNIELTNTKMREISGANLLIWGVDSNEGDYANGGYKDWYKQANSQVPSTTDYSWNDPVFEACAGGRGCLEDNWTGGAGGRIDYLFFNAAATSSHGKTITYNEGDAADLQFTGSDREDLNYSGHRAISARIHY
ncbi:hypothetical protein [Archangium sp. Cb G35]|uniref:hypothetical protein n=1 Tax=Archangium sp. Cb G35 TaxID=1920190 RepID=UPI0011611322|nr:hypothetical protein [Archangium sp. Cb G35]